MSDGVEDGDGDGCGSEGKRNVWRSECFDRSKNSRVLLAISFRSEMMPEASISCSLRQYGS